MAKRGPKTEEGKAVVRLNPVRHGVLSPTPVIPGLEREEDWQAHRTGVLSSLTPEGHLEMALADRVALLLWRLARITRYECGIIDSAQKRIPANLREEGGPDRLWFDDETIMDPDAIALKIKTARDYYHLLDGLLEAENTVPISAMDVCEIMLTVAEEAQVHEEEVELPTPLSDAVSDPESFEGCTIGPVREWLQAIAARAGREVEDIWNKVCLRAEEYLATRIRGANRIAPKRERLVRERLLPDEQGLGKVIRYEAHLHRQLLQTLHELEAIQARREGLRTPLARVDVQGLADQ
jgi:hypothetical protein